MRRRYVLLFRRATIVRFQTLGWITRHRGIAALLAMLALLVVCFLVAPALQNALAAQFTTPQRIATLQTLVMTLGGAFIGATAIAFSVVMFAVQINFARMPYGLFQRLSSDVKLLGAFAATFLAAIAIASLSLFPDKTWLAFAVIGASYGTILILALFLYSYRRALLLINPLYQLRLLVERACEEMRIWDRRARRAAPLLEIEDNKDDEPAALRSSHDRTRLVYFQANPYWTASAEQQIAHAISFARRYAEQGDYEVSGQALNAVIAIHASYVQTKGKTFFAHQLLLVNPLATDPFINDTLEHLRQTARIATTRRDEQQIEQTLAALAGLVRVYMAIDYSNEYAQEKHHAQLAAGYLTGAVQDIVPHNMPDVLMEGVRLMGQSAQLFLSVGQPNQIATLSEKIAAIAATGIVKESYRPVTLTGMEQLAHLTSNLIRTKTDEIRFAARQLRKDVGILATLFLNVPDTPLASTHSTYLSPYYSMTKKGTLGDLLTDLTNALVAAKADDKEAATVIRHVEEWADGLYQFEKDLLLAAIAKRSHLAFDIMHWLVHLTKLLVALSLAEACPAHTREKLEGHASWLIAVLSWVPDDKETVDFVENYGMTELLFEASLDAMSRDCLEVFISARDTLISWAFKAGGHQTRWAILERSIYALATLVLRKEDWKLEPWLKRAITERLTKPNAPDQEARDHAARDIRRTIHTLYRNDFALSLIERALQRTDHAKLRPLLEEAANILSPATAEEPVDIS